MKKLLLSWWTVSLLAVFLTQGESAWAQKTARVHAVADLGHQFTFYADGRFHKQYLPGQPYAASWGSLFNYDLSNANLLILLGCDAHLEYVREDVESIKRFMQQGGGVVLLGSARDEGQGALAGKFGCSFGSKAQGPFTAQTDLITGDIEGGGDTLSLRNKRLWQFLILDANKSPVLARRKFGEGVLLVGARGLAGHNPNASDNINAKWWQPLLVELAAGKRVDAAKPFRSRGIRQLEYVDKLGSIDLRYSDYLKPYAKSMADIYMRCRPVIEKRMGVPLSKGMASEIGLLATGGGGFSSGRTLGLAVFWGGFPDREDSMIEFITHESVHSWVLPFPEIWNEPIATYVGNLVMIDMGYEEEALRRIEATVQRAARIDPTMKLYDLRGNGSADARELNGGEANNIHWGKTYWVLEQLRKENPQIIADYFRTKRRLATPDKIKKFDEHDTVALLSIAMKRDLFKWFCDHGINVDRDKCAAALRAAK